MSIKVKTKRKQDEQGQEAQVSQPSQDFLKALRDFAEISRILTSVRKDYDEYLETLRLTDNEFRDLSTQISNYSEALSHLQAQLDRVARSEKVSAEADGAQVKFSNPTQVVVDREKLLDLFPSAGEISGLFNYSVNVDNFDGAVEAGLIPQEVARQVKKEEPRYKNGRVTLTPPKS